MRHPEPGTAIFITGGSSALGRRVVRQLSSAGWSVCCLLRSPSAERELFNYANVSVIRGDCRSPKVWEDKLEGISILLHLAPIALAPQIVAAAIRQKVSSCVAISSIRVHSPEGDPLKAGIVEGERAIRESELRFIILRCAMIYGARADENIHRVVRWLDKRTWMPLLDRGHGMVQPLHIDDLVQAIELSLQFPDAASNRVLELGGGSAVTWKAMVELVAEIGGKRVRWLPVPIEIAEIAARGLAALSPRYAGIAGLIQRMGNDRTCDIDGARRALPGWSPLELKEGLERTYASDV